MNAARLIDLSDVPTWLDCCQCGALKPVAEFVVDSRNTRRGGHRSECRDCRNANKKRYRLMARLIPQMGRINAI
jgi:hypothetical protein